MVSWYSSNTTPLERKGEKMWFWTVRGLAVAHSSYRWEEEREPRENPLSKFLFSVTVSPPILP